MWIIINGEPKNTYLIKSISRVQELTVLDISKSDAGYLCKGKWAEVLLKFVPIKDIDQIRYQLIRREDWDSKGEFDNSRILGFFFCYYHDNFLQYSYLYESREEADKALDSFLENLNEIEMKVKRIKV